MPRIHLSFTERRRRNLAMKVDRLDRLEKRSTVTPFTAFSLAAGAFQGLSQLGMMQSGGGGNALSGPVQPDATAQGAISQSRAVRPQARGASGDFLPINIVPAPSSAAGGGAPAAQEVAGAARAKAPADDELTKALAPSSDTSSSTGISTPWKPASRTGGGAALPPRGGSGNGALPTTLSAVQGHSPRSQASSVPAPPSSIPGLFIPPTPQSGHAASPLGPTTTHTGSAQHPHSGIGPVLSPDTGGTPPTPPTIPENPSSLPYAPTSGGQNLPLIQFPYYPLYTLDYIQGITIFPNGYEIGSPDGNVDLRAQVKNTTGVTFSWNTSGLTNAYNISGASTYDLTFNWDQSIASPVVNSVTLTATSGSQQETQTYYFYVTAGTVTYPTGSANWPTTLSPDTVNTNAMSWSSDGVSVDANSGALDTSIDLPSYNPNISGIALTYDSLTANPMPIIVVPHTLAASQSVSSAVNATLTFNSVAGTTWYYNTSQFIPGDVQQIALQANATSLSTGRYSYSAQIVDERSTNTTSTYTGTATVLNESTSAFGDGWTLQGLQQITSASGGVILNLGDGGKSLWFSGSPGVGGNYTTPAGDFSTLTKTSSGYTRTLTDGTQITFNSSGYETSMIDLNGLHTTYAYNGSNQLTTITDTYNNITMFTYISGELSTIKDPAGRLTTFTFTGSDLTAVQQADSSRVTYTYDSAGRMTQVQDQRSNVVSIAYDSAERVGTITRPDSTAQTFSAYQEQGWTNSGTSGSPAAATLLAESAANYTDPNSNLTQMRPDWYGLGLTGQSTDAMGNVSTYDLNSNGLATAAIDQLNRIAFYNYDSLGNMTKETYPDGNTDQYSYNSFSEPLTHTDANGHETYYTYDSHGNNTVIKDPLNNLTTMTYTSTGRLQTMTDANNHTTSYQYDSQDRQTTVTFPDGTTNLYSYNSQGNVIKSTDGRGNATTYSYDALNRTTGTTDAIGNHTTVTYDADGNRIAVTDPLNHTTSYAYDSMNRVTTVTDPLGHTTVYGYDSDGNKIYAKDPLGRITTYVYDALNDNTVVEDPVSGNTTTSTYDAASDQLTSTGSQGTTTYTYSIRGWNATTTDPLNNVVTFMYSATGQVTYQEEYYQGREFAADEYGYDADGRVQTYNDGLGYTTSYSYDGVGNKLTSTDPNDNITTYVYNSMNRLVETIEPASVTVSYTYDGSGNQQTVTDALGHTTTTLYDADNRATTMISAISGTTTMTYDADGRETSLTDPVGNKTQWAYDADGRMTTMTLPNGHTVTNVYDADNELVDTTDADGRRTTYSYNVDGDQTGESWLNGSGGATYIATYTYNASDEMTGAADPSGILTFTYNADGELQTDATSGPGSGQPTVTLTYSYDQLGDQTSVTDSLSSQGITTYSYDPKQEMTGISTSYGGTAGPLVSFTYDNGGRLTFTSRLIGGSGTEVNTTVTYDSANRVLTTTYGADTHGMYGWSDSPIATYVYGYDSASRLTSEKDAEGTATFTYDNANELTAVGGSRTESYSYDLNGNRTGTGYSTTIMNETATSPGTTYTYDSAGNMITAQNGSTVTTYTYDARNRLTGVTQGGTIIATYTYDVLNRRIGIDDSGTQTWTVYDGKSADALPYADFNGSGSLTMRYLSGKGVVNGPVVDQIMARTSSGGTTAWYLTDKLGSVRDIVSSSGSELDHIVYDSFGNIVTQTNASNGDRFKYAGMEYDATTGQYYDRARDYDSTIGRFMALDPKGFAADDNNLYRYVGDGPTDGTDPSGLLGITIDVAFQLVARGQRDDSFDVAISGAITVDPGCALVALSVTFQTAAGRAFDLVPGLPPGSVAPGVKYEAVTGALSRDWIDANGRPGLVRVIVTAVEARYSSIVSMRGGFPTVGIPIPTYATAIHKSRYPRDDLAGGGGPVGGGPIGADGAPAPGGGASAAGGGQAYGVAPSGGGEPAGGQADDDPYRYMNVP